MNATPNSTSGSSGNSSGNSSGLDERLRRDLARRAGTATIPDLATGRAAIDHVVHVRSHRRRQRRVALAAVVVVAVVASALALVHRGGRQGTVVTGPSMEIPPMPQLGLSPSSGQWSIFAVAPGTETVIELRTPTIGYATLAIQLSDLPLSSFHAAAYLDAQNQGVSALGSVQVDHHPGFTTLVSDSEGLVPALPDATVLWKPDPRHIASLMLSGRSGTDGASRAVELANSLVSINDAAWWQALAQPGRAQNQVTTADTQGRAPDSEGLLAPGARLGLPDGGSVVVAYRPQDGLTSALDVPGFPPGTFQVITYPSLPPPQHDLDHTDHRVRVRGTTGVFTPTGTATNRSGRNQLSWIEDGVIVQLTGGPPNLLAGTTGDTASLPDEAAMVRLADRLQVLGLDTWRGLLSPTTLRTDVVYVPPNGEVPCLQMCPLTLMANAAHGSGSTSVSSTTTSLPGPSTTARAR